MDENTTQKILLPVDDSPTTRRTINTVIAQKKHFPTTLTLLHIVNIDRIAHQLLVADLQIDMVKKNSSKLGQQLLEKIDKQLCRAGFTNHLLLKFGDPRREIADIANNQNFQLVVIGRHKGGGEIRDVLFGSVANYVLHNVRCPVLLF